MIKRLFHKIKIMGDEVRLFVLTIIAGVLLLGCEAKISSYPEIPAEASGHPLNIKPDRTFSAEAPSQAPPAQEASASISEPQHLTEEIVTGSGIVAHPRSSSTKISNEEKAFSLNFVNADIREVMKAVLGDMLNLNYVIAPAVQGNITIKVNQPLAKEDLIPALNTALKLNGVTIVSGSDVVKVVPLSEAPHQGSKVFLAHGKQIDHGFGQQIAPLRNISAEEMEKILKQVAPNGGVTPVETNRNILILTGTEEERTAMMDVIDSFDVDWLTGMSFGLFPLKEASARTLTSELWEVLGTQAGPLSKIVRLVPFDRLNAVLVVSSQPRYLKEIKAWISRLDVDHAPSERKLWVYQVQNGRASDLSRTLQKLVPGQEQRAETQGRSDRALAMPAIPFSSDPTIKSAVQSQPPSPSSADASMDFSGSGLRIIADETTNAIIIWATKSEYALIESALKKLDIVPMQVRIEAAIAEVTLTDDLRYGVQYLFRNKHEGALLTNASNLSVSSTLPGFSAFVTGSNINAVLDLLQSVTAVHVISSPQLMVLNNQTAILQVGDQVPIATQSAVSTLTAGAPVVNSIEMKDTGVILKVTPRVNASGMVLMDISQEVSDVASTTTSQIELANYPGAKNREFCSCS